MRKTSSRYARTLVVALLCVTSSTLDCFAAEHICPDYAEFEKTLEEGKSQLKALPVELPQFPAVDGPLGDWTVRRIIRTPDRKAHSRESRKDSESESEPKKLSRLEADRIVDALDRTNLADSSGEFYATAQSMRLLASGYFNESSDVWKKMLAYKSARYGEKSSEASLCKAYLARIQILQGVEELNSDLKKSVQAVTGGELSFMDVAFHASPTFCTGDRKKLELHWSSARELYLQALSELEKDKTRSRLVELIKIQLACLDEWSGQSEQAFDRAIDALTSLPDRDLGVALIGIDGFFGASFDDRSGAFLLRYVIFHRDWHRAEIVTNILLSKRSKKPPLFKELLSAYCANGRRSDAWILMNKLADADEISIAGDSLPLVIAGAPVEEKAQVFAFLKRVPATKSDARALEAKGWFVEAENRYIELNDHNPNSEFYRFELADFYQRRQNWRAAEAVYLKMVAGIRQICINNVDSAKECKSLLVGVSSSISDSEIREREFSKVREDVERLDALCDKQIAAAECLKLSQELYNTAFSLEKRGEILSAKKLYASSLEIKEKNLAENDTSKVAVLVDLARIDAQEGNSASATTKFERALKLCQRGASVPNESFLYAIENYGEFLSKSNQSKKAEEIYSLARKLNKQWDAN